MQCYYEVLNISKCASDDEIKKSYRKLALKWHPDKNLNNSQEAKVQFQLVQQAYEVLGDAHERAWYDKHRESILKGGAGYTYEDSSLDVFKFFTSSCFHGYGDDEKSFYSVYREVFNKISAEDVEYHSEGESDFEIPNFGRSDSPFDDIVNPFYSYWQSYSTKKSYAWLNVHDINEAPNRKVARLMDKDNKKIRDRAKKERNEEVRALVAFVKKRDKRVQAHALAVKAKKEETEKKFKENRLLKIRERKNEISSQIESEWSKFSNFEKELKDIEANLDVQFGQNTVSESSEESCADNEEPSLEHDSLYCIACNKIFKTAKAFENHENSKKHKDNVISLKLNVYEEDTDCHDTQSFSNENPGFSTTCNDGTLSLKNCISLPDKHKLHKLELAIGDDEMDIKMQLESLTLDQKKKRNRYKKPSVIQEVCLSSDEPDLIGLDEELLGKSKKQKKKVLQQKFLKSLKTMNTTKCNQSDVKPKNNLCVKETSEISEKNHTCSSIENHQTTPKEFLCTTSQPMLQPTNGNIDTEKDHTDLIPDGRPSNSDKTCAICKCSFPSKTKLFNHLKSSGHAVYLPTIKKHTSKSKK